MNPDDFRTWVQLAVIVGTQVGVFLLFVYRKGGERKQLDNDREINTTQHTTLDGKIRNVRDDLGEVRKATARAHERIDAHAVRIGMLDANGQSLKEQMVAGFTDIHTSIRDLRKDIMDVLKHGNGNGKNGA